MLTCRMPCDTTNSITGHDELLLSGEMSLHKIKIKCMKFKMCDLNENA